MKQERCQEVASAGEPPYLREFQLKLGNNFYFIKVTHPAYLKELMERNAQRPFSAQVDEIIYAFEGVTAEQLSEMSEMDVCLRLHQTPIEKLKPFLIEQSPTD